MPLLELKDVRPPVDLPANYFWLVLLLGLLFVLSLIFLFFWFKRRFAAEKKIQVIIKSAWELAYEELAELVAQNLSVAGEVEQYFVRLSGIVRYYLERRFSISAPEMTTDEFLLYVEKLTVLDPQHKQLLKEFLMLSDMVKFARYRSTSKEMQDAIVVVKRLIDETIPKLATA